MEERQLPTLEDVMKKIKDEGDFDALRLKIIRAVKENEELRKSIVDQIKQSDILNQDESEDMKPRQLSDAIYQEIGRKIMGQISDEIWKAIRLNDSIKDDIKGTVEHVLNKMVGTEPQGSKAPNPSLPNEDQNAGKEAKGTIKASIATPTREASILNSNETNHLPLGLPSSGDRADKSSNSEDEQKPSWTQNTKESVGQTKDPQPGLGSSHAGANEADDDSELPPGFS